MLPIVLDNLLWKVMKPFTRIVYVWLFQSCWRCVCANSSHELFIMQPQFSPQKYPSLKISRNVVYCSQRAMNVSNPDRRPSCMKTFTGDKITRFHTCTVGDLNTNFHWDRSLNCCLASPGGHNSQSMSATAWNSVWIWMKDKSVYYVCPWTSLVNTQQMNV